MSNNPPLRWRESRKESRPLALKRPELWLRQSDRDWLAPNHRKQSRPDQKDAGIAEKYGKEEVKKGRLELEIIK